MALAVLWICLGVIFLFNFLLCYPATIKDDVRNVRKNGSLKKARDLTNPFLKINGILGFASLYSLWLPAFWAMAETKKTVGIYICALICFLSLLVGIALAVSFVDEAHGNNTFYTALRINICRFASPFAFVTLIIYLKYREQGRQNVSQSAAWEKQGLCGNCGSKLGNEYALDSGYDNYYVQYYVNCTNNCGYKKHSRMEKNGCYFNGNKSSSYASHVDVRREAMDRNLRDYGNFSGPGGGN